MTDAWGVRQQRRHNLDSYRHQPKPPRQVHKFTDQQLAIASAVVERLRKKGEE